jgi:hypothetical protein
LRRALGRNPLDAIGIFLLLIAAGAILDRIRRRSSRSSRVRLRASRSAAWCPQCRARVPKVWWP